MNNYNISTEEITTIITLYSQIKSPQKRMFVQGYLKGIQDVSLVDDFSKDNEIEKDISNKPKQTA